MEFAAQRQRTLVGVTLATLLLLNLPFDGVLLYPFKLFATWLHEASHGVVMLITGAGFDRMDIYRDTSGLAHSVRGVGDNAQGIIAAAGYMGTPVFGALFLVLGQTRSGARSILAILGGSLLVTAILYVSNPFGLKIVYGGAACFFAAALLANESVAYILVNIVAVQACCNALLDIRILFRPNLVVNGNQMASSDAHTVASLAPFGSPRFWAITWLLWSFLLLFIALRVVYLRQNRRDENKPATQPETAKTTTSITPSSADLSAQSTVAPTDENDCSG